MTKSTRSGTVLIYSIHRSEPWWRHVGENLGYERAVVVSDLRDEGDYCVVDDFYAAYHPLYAARATASDLLDAGQVDDIIARCRVLRWLPRRKAAAMALAMAVAFAKVLDAENPRFIVSWPIDRYVSDVLERLAHARGIPYFELTVSAVADMVMLLYRGQLMTRIADPAPAEVEARVHEIADPLFTPSYVQGQSSFTALRFLRVFGYFRLRGWVFRAISLIKRDPLNLHYLDSQAFLGHKPHIGDIRIVRMLDRDWRGRIAAFPRERRLFIALQLFPEASIDYAIANVKLIEHEDMLIEVARAFSAAGYVIVIKDHPLQYGFRQVQLLERFRILPNVVLVHYEVSGNAVLAECGVNFTCTGTLGMQASLLGLKSITVDTYYTTPGDFIFLDAREDIPLLPARVEATPPPEALRERQRRIVSHLLRGSFPGDFLSFRGFDAASPPPSVAELARNLGAAMDALGPDGEAWHARHAKLRTGQS